jgi:hypothetical protein
MSWSSALNAWRRSEVPDSVSGSLPLSKEKNFNRRLGFANKGDD